jgi:hypothetical protein
VSFENLPGRCLTRTRRRSNLAQTLCLSRPNELRYAPYSDLLLLLARLRNVIRGLHLHQRIHLHAKRFFNPERHDPRKVSFAVCLTLINITTTGLSDDLVVRKSGGGAASLA